MKLVDFGYDAHFHFRNYIWTNRNTIIRHDKCFPIISIRLMAYIIEILLLMKILFKYFFFFLLLRQLFRIFLFSWNILYNRKRARLMQDDIFYSRSEHDGPTYAVMSQSHEYEFHCSTHVPWLSHMSCVHILLSPAR